MQIRHLALSMILLAALQTPPPKLLDGRLNDRLVAEGMMAQIEIKPSDDRDLPSVAEGDLVFRVNTPQFRAGGGGLLIALVETRDGGWLFVDTNLDGRLAESERTAYRPTEGRELTLEITLTTPGTPVLPFRCRVATEQQDGRSRRFLYFTASFRAEGYADIGGRRTLVSLPFDPGRGIVDVRRGKIGIDVNGDGTVDLRGLEGPEVKFVRGEQLIFHVGDRYISIESADYTTRSLVLREHAAEEYTLIEVRTGEPIPDFSFTDFDGRARKLSDFKGKYVLLDFWGSWCPPCVADLPHLKAAYTRFRERDFEILGIDFEHSATTDAVRALMKEKEVSWTNATPESIKDLVEKRFRIMGFPTLILLDPDGVVIEARGSVLRGEALMSTLERALAKR